MTNTVIFMNNLCKNLKKIIFIMGYSDEFCTLLPPWKALLELGVKTTARIHVPAKPYGMHFWNWISFPTRNVPFGLTS